MDKAQQRQALTLKQREWLEAAVRALIKRAGQYAADPNKAWPEITNSDLPPL
jgi:hexokinase